MCTDPGRTGVTTGKFKERAGDILWRVHFADGSQGFYPDSELLVIADDDDNSGP